MTYGILKSWFTHTFVFWRTTLSSTIQMYGKSMILKIPYLKIYMSISFKFYILVKAPLRVLYDKIQHEGWGRVANTARGEAECCICHETTPRVLYFIVQHEYTVLLLICWCCVGGLMYFDSILDRCFRLLVLAALTE